MGYPLLRNPKILLSPPRERIKVRGPIWIFIPTLGFSGTGILPVKIDRLEACPTKGEGLDTNQFLWFEGALRAWGISKEINSTKEDQGYEDLFSLRINYCRNRDSRFYR
jgi:hypothetical protein